MALTMHRGKGTVRFEWTDGVIESSVTLLPEDGEDLLVDKLKRVISLVEGVPAPAGDWRDVVGLQRAVGRPVGPVQFGVDPAGPPAIVQTGNGWASVTPIVAPELPEDRQGEWEMIPPGEDA